MVIARSKMNFLIAGFFLLCLCSQAGCSGVYDGMNSAYLNNCYHLPYPEQQECLREVETSYDKYEMERQDLLKSDKKQTGAEVRSQ